MTERVVEDPILEQRYIFRRLTGADGSEVMQVDTWVDPGGGVPIPHIHHGMEERFEVLEGEVTFLVGRRHLRAGPGEKAAVPPGVRHAYRNSGQTQARVICEVAHPKAQQLQLFLEEAAALNREGDFTRRGIPKSFSAALKGAVMLHHYREMVEFTMPPRSLQRLLIGPLARLGERRGYVGGRLAKETASS
jgi:mannose-6-phosphate isomerase-like protein (cupin superfamily)